jgi:hypothetical protein
MAAAIVPCDASEGRLESAIASGAPAMRLRGDSMEENPTQLGKVERQGEGIIGRQEIIGGVASTALVMSKKRRRPCRLRQEIASSSGGFSSGERERIGRGNGGF